MNTFGNIDPRLEFPIRERYTYLNHASISPIPMSTQAAIAEFARDAAEEGPINYPAWMHATNLARETAAAMINAPSAQDICFVKNTSHGLVVVANSINWQPGDNVVGFQNEFIANILPWQNLARRGVELRLVPERGGYFYEYDDLVNLIDERTRLVTVSWVEYATGLRHDLARLAEICRERGVLFCVDAMQGLGVLPVDVQATPIDFLMADGHKWLLAPEGCGILYINPAVIPQLNDDLTNWYSRVEPYNPGSGELKPNAMRYEEGTNNHLAINALGASMRLLTSVGSEAIQERIFRLTQRLIEELHRRDYFVVTPEEWTRRAGIVSFIKDGLEPDAVVKHLQEQHQVVTSTRRGFLRVSPHFYNDDQDVERVLAALDAYRAG